jgi:hypothetical protein
MIRGMKLAISVMLFIQVTNNICVFSQAFSVSFPFEVDSLRGFVCIQLSINEREPRWFILDTGANNAYLTYEAAEHFGVSIDKSKKEPVSMSWHGKIEGYVVDQPPPLALSTQLTRMGSFTYKIQGPIVIFPSDFRFDSVLIRGRLVRPAGMVGLNIFGEQVIRICYDTQTLTIANEPLREGWVEITGKPCYGDFFCARINVGDYTFDALIDSGLDAELSLNRDWGERLKQYLWRPFMEFETRTLYDAFLIPPVKIGELALSILRVQTHTPALPPILGSFGMLHFNWQFDCAERRVYVQLRRNPPRFYCKAHLLRSTFIQCLGNECTITAVPRSEAERLGVIGECALVAINDIPLREIQQHFGTQRVVNFYQGLVLSPIIGQVRLQVRCNDDLKEIIFDNVLSLRDQTSISYFISKNRIFSGIETYDDEFMVRFRPESPAKFSIDGKPIQLGDKDEVKLHLIRIVGLDSDKPTIEEFFLHLRSHLLQGKPVQLVCKDEQGREVLVEIPAAEPPKAGDTPSQETSSPAPPKETEDE